MNESIKHHIIRRSLHHPRNMFLYFLLLRARFQASSYHTLLSIHICYGAFLRACYDTKHLSNSISIPSLPQLVLHEQHGQLPLPNAPFLDHNSLNRPSPFLALMLYSAVPCHVIVRGENDDRDQSKIEES